MAPEDENLPPADKEEYEKWAPEQTVSTRLPTLSDRLIAQLNLLEEVAKRGDEHQCRFCAWFDCGDSCKCGCGRVKTEVQAVIDQLRELVQATKTGEVPS